MCSRGAPSESVVEGVFRQGISEFGGLRVGRPRRRFGTNDLARLDIREAWLRKALCSRHTASIEADGTRLHITYSSCSFGGRRPWLVCDGCGRRRLVLYRREAAVTR